MCGITAIIYKNKANADKEILKVCADMVTHRGPDGSGYECWNNVGLGHRRLAIIDTSDDGKQPFVFEHLSVTYNGEIYNYRELAAELKSLGYVFETKCDTEVLIKAWHAWGEKCLEKMRGMWAFALLDKIKNTIIFCRDRFGIKPLQYFENAEVFAAVSEIKQLYPLPGFIRRINHQTAYNFLRYGTLHHTENTFYEGVKTLTGGHFIQFDLSNNSHEIKKWYDLKAVKLNSTKSAADEFRERFEESVKIHLRSDVPLGYCLSGGLDSSAIVCMSRNLMGGEAELHSVTSCSSIERYDEREYAEAAANSAHTVPHYIYPDLGEIFKGDTLDRITWQQDAPIASGSHFSEFAVFREAKRIGMTVMLDGQGSDEYLGGYDWYFLYRCISLFKRKKFATLHRAINARSKRRNTSAKQFYKDLLSKILKPEKQQLLPDWFNKEWASKYDSSTAGWHDGASKIKSFKELSYWEIVQSSIPYLLHSEDRNGMMHSIESRMPFLDHLLLESMFARDEDELYHHDTDKFPLREGLKDILPEKIYSRKTKLGFASSDEVYIKENAEDVRSKLATDIDALQPLINKKELLKTFDDFVNGKSAFNTIFFRVLALASWKRSCEIKF